ncbi:MAG: Superkiller protein 3 [Trizodia sp. TS-e1964]|nr:MAG: Superkiller protein 3 [Trizodia sp. TS-e1964]
MSSTKAALKAAKAALDAQNYTEVLEQCQKVLALDSGNYHANVFSGIAFEKQSKYEASVDSYRKAIKTKGNDPLAWQGLISLYEKLGGKEIGECQKATVQLAELYHEANDKAKCQTVIDKFVSHVRQHGTPAQQKLALEVLLPSSKFYDYLEGRILHPSITYSRLADIIEDEEKQRINRAIGERRTRLGAKISQVTTEVKREVFEASSLEKIYQHVIDWTPDDEIRRSYEEKLLQRCYDTLVILPADKKPEKLAKVEELYRGMVILKHPFLLAWDLALEWQDGASLSEWDLGILKEYIEFFPDNGLSLVLSGFLSSEISPFPQQIPPLNTDELNSPKEGATNGLSPEPPLAAEERLLLMTDGIEKSKLSILAHRLLAEYYLHLEEYEGAVDCCRIALNLLALESKKSGKSLQEYQSCFIVSNSDSILITLATSLVYYQSPKNHPEAKSLFEDLLRRKTTSTPVLIGLGLILKDQEHFPEAIEFLSQAVERNPTNANIRAELAWCRALQGNYKRSQEELTSCLPLVEVVDQNGRQLKAQILYRIGICIWHLDPSSTSRKDRKGAYSWFLKSLQANINFAPPYTSLGLYYADYANDKARARKCFQKAFELSHSELESAERLAISFADESDWDLVELVSTRVIDSGRAKPAPGSKRKGCSWPFAAMGVVELNRQDYAKSIVSFQTALRISPHDYHSWVGLGESYHNSGRYVAATKAFQQAEDVERHLTDDEASDRWFAKYMLSNVKRELGDYSNAITGYQEVMKLRPREFGLSIALIQTLVESAWHDIEIGCFGKAADSAIETIKVACNLAIERSDAFNLWKSLGDACSIFSFVQGHIEEYPSVHVSAMLQKNIDINIYDQLAEGDQIGKEILLSFSKNESTNGLANCLHAAILAHKRAVLVSASDPHAQAVAWYNLGWSEYRAHICLNPSIPKSSGSKYLKASIKCFKRAIESEAGNSEFWNALGIATAQLNPQIAQHSFIRSLYLNDKNARIWTNLGTLYLLQNDLQLANDAFARAQSTDPDYAPAWLGQGILALLYSDPKEAQIIFSHAHEIADSESLPAKRQYASSMFDNLSSTDSGGPASLVQPLFALRQLQSLRPNDMAHQHLFSLFSERVGSFTDAASSLASVCASAEADYEVTESSASLVQFAQSKADLSRVQLALHEYSASIESAELALQLTEDSDEPADVPSEDHLSRQAFRLSAHLSAGLAHFFSGSLSPAIDMFRAALEESCSAPDIVCLLAQVLWAKHEKALALDQLLAVAENAPEHIPSKILLGAAALLDSDADMLEAVAADLEALRGSETPSSDEMHKINALLAAIAARTSKAAELTAVNTCIMLRPYAPSGWRQLVPFTDDAYPAEMARAMAERSAPPIGALEVAELAGAFLETRVVGDVQRAIMAAPWLEQGWRALVGTVASS